MSKFKKLIMNYAWHIVSIIKMFPNSTHIHDKKETLGKVGMERKYLKLIKNI